MHRAMRAGSTVPSVSSSDPGPVGRPSALRRRWRARWLDVHLVLGLSVGIVFTLLGVTGALLVFYVEIDGALNPLPAGSSDGVRRSHEAVFQALRQAHPSRDRAWRLEMPMAAGQPVTARYYRAPEKARLAFAPLVVQVDPVTLRVGPARFWGEFAMTWIYDLHYTLLLDRTGKTMLGILGLTLLVSLATGLWLWWPSGRRWRSALQWKRQAGPARRIYDLHTLTGVYGALVLLVIVLTGVMLEVPGWVNPWIDRVSPLRAAVLPRSSMEGRAHRIDVDEAVRVGQTRFPSAELRWIETPDGTEGAYRINLHQRGEPGRRFPKTNVWVDQYTGAVLAVRDPRTDRAGDTMLAWLHPLHSGEALGLPGRLLVLASGLAPGILLITGCLRWRHKRRAAQAARSTG